MRVESLETRPLTSIRYTNAGKRGGIEHCHLPVFRARVDSLPQGLNGILASSDLQGVAPDPKHDGELRLLGEVLIRHLDNEELLPEKSRLGAILAGDLYSSPEGDVRGATGDVRSIWASIADRAAWVAGVAGNHDTFGSLEETASFRSLPGIHLLDTDVVELNGITIAGVGGVVGDPAKHSRQWPEDYITALELLLESQPDIVVLHQSPMGPDGQRGNPELRDALMRFFAGGREAPLFITGHDKWAEPHALLGHVQVVNVNSRGVLFTQS